MLLLSIVLPVPVAQCKCEDLTQAFDLLLVSSTSDAEIWSEDASLFVTYDTDGREPFVAFHIGEVGFRWESP